ncbi:site-2 protease family protein [Legionella jordanis]|uniref:Transmembrane protein n=1 Tax=Legionella jordanis TaxID=456 RepID=A0A0W0V8H2_9GAMM|nr:site-2 protease family protein [Legionella jordanis]KTD16437.1 transmembrane protein [Legionella jordanis]RMX04362.1 site-2 protease family protein [Legionella jordanis]RMX15552.1 site-2 protease family protein [Legionella jordanis]VEH12103.1 transmembrane protein [Legionella jordanis]HAT8715000.1 site-2 protease family protein [Legionella jordanis]
MLELSTVQQITIWLIPVLFAITLHEAAHGWVAYRLGDTTAKMMGRLSFNPLRHIDLFGTVIVPIVILILSQFNFVFGWAKPVPINPSQFRNPRRDVALATAAGPLSNLLMALMWAGLFKLGLMLNPQSSNAALFLVLSSRAGIIINLLLAWLNLIPIPPLDGSRILGSLLPANVAVKYEKIEPFGFIILLLLMFTGILGFIINPPIQWSLQVLRGLFNL